MKRKLLNVLFVVIIILTMATMVREVTNSKYFNKKNDAKVHHSINDDFI